MKHTVKIIIIGFLAGLGGTFAGYQYLIKPELSEMQEDASFSSVSLNSTGEYQGYSTSDFKNVPADADGDFSKAAARALPSVVFINSISQGVSYNYWDWFFGENGGRQTQMSSGSGVIFTSDGYIITNNHVIQSAERIEVNYNKRVYPAQLIGTDPSSDLAVIKINETNLPAVAIGSSKNVQVGEWVLAVGNPFTLASTVTAGIVSAKGRRIGILEDKFPIESFIQTDAAINPGNSGGALVNKTGELIGINTAILSRTGSYTGYAFAVPVDIAKKVFDDLVKYGVVQKAFIGGGVVEYDYENAEKYGLDTEVKSYNGVLLAKLDKEGPAASAGLQLGDVIVKVGDVNVNTQSAFEEEMGYRYPGDKVNLTYIRDGQTAVATLTLVNRDGTTDIIKRKIVPAPQLGANLEATQYGVKVFQMKERSVLKQIGIPENFTIIGINRVRVKEPEDVIEFFKKFKGRGSIIGVNSSKQQLEIPFIIR
ncbi:MAG TPA: trypsin-like peptidase domain-containing protein [Chryseosolibacter sp.]|nr:trypsin-like peptidase domain-containing protein [Chryseosolibacter sp.]